MMEIQQQEVNQNTLWLTSQYNFLRNQQQQNSSSINFLSYAKPRLSHTTTYSYQD